MCSKVTLVCFGWFTFVSTTPLVIYNNAQFAVTNVNFRLAVLFPNVTQSKCICQCSNNSSCITRQFFGINETCILFSTHLKQGYLSLTTTNNFASVFSFTNRTALSLGCHICPTSSHESTCSSIVFSNMNCTVSARCQTEVGASVQTNITLTPGLGNSNGRLACYAFCN